jgi:pimeloyl-ACP methyl ester carboxylesterase
MSKDTGRIAERAAPPGGSLTSVPRVSRRSVLFGGLGLITAAAVGGYELIRSGALPGKYELAELDGACGSGPPSPQGPRPVSQHATFYSAYRRRTVEMVTLIPPGAPHRAGLVVAVALHGYGSNATAFARVAAVAMTAGHIRNLAVICPDGGSTYWHKRADGDDPAGMIVHEVLPRARVAGLATSRIGMVGESMGGYGALLMTEQLSRAHAADAASPAIAAVAALSPAIFGSYADAEASNRAAFDSQADFARNDLFTGISALRHVPTWIACGDDDPFAPEVTRFRARLQTVTGRLVPGGVLAGCHDDAFFERNMPAALQFLSAQRAS